MSRVRCLRIPVCEAANDMKDTAPVPMDAVCSRLYHVISLDCGSGSLRAQLAAASTRPS